MATTKAGTADASPRERRLGPVTADVVVSAALKIIDEEGLEALTMRRLAKDLGVEPVTIYRQLPNKEAILAGVAERLWHEMPGPPADTARAGTTEGEMDWRTQVRAMWLALHRLMQAHPNAIPIIAKGGGYSAGAGAGGTAAMADAFRRAGLSPAEAGELLHILAASVVGFGFATLWSRQIARGERPDAPASESEPAAPADELDPYLAAMARWDPAQYERALDIVLGAYGRPQQPPV